MKNRTLGYGDGSGNDAGAPPSRKTNLHEGRKPPSGSRLSRLRNLAEKHAQPAHDEDAYYHPTGHRDPWEGIGYLLAALAVGVAGWLAWGWWTGLMSN